MVGPVVLPGGMACGWGRATREEGSPPYWAFQQVVRGLSSVDFEVASAAERFRLFETVTDFLVRTAELAGEPVVTRLRLTGLAEPEVAAQLAEITGWAVPDSVSAAVWRRTQGNPFFVGELGRLLVDSPAGGHEELPVGVRDAVRDRLARLSPACREWCSRPVCSGRS